MISTIFLLIVLMVQPGARCVHPHMLTTAVNVTVAEGRTAILPCRIRDLGRHKVKVVWIDQWHSVLTFNNDRIIDNARLKVQRPSTHEWNLRLDRVKFADQGLYTCRVNTEPPIHHSVLLTVVVPPSITSPVKDREVSVREFEEVSLTCNATGLPDPTITWYRLPSLMGEEPEKVGATGEVLIIHNITRQCGGQYQCEASNTVYPSATRVWEIRVEFEPEVHLANKRLSQSLGKDTVLECLVTGYPQANVFWSFNETKLGSSQKHKLEILRTNSTYVTLNLHIHRIQLGDFGYYTCTANNPLGRAQKSMVLREHKSRFRTRKTTTSPPAAPSLGASSSTRANNLHAWNVKPNSRQRSGHQSKGKAGLIHNTPDIIDMSFRESGYIQHEKRPEASKIKDDKNSASAPSPLRSTVVFSAAAIFVMDFVCYLWGRL